jgi:hypothetical protein
MSSDTPLFDPARPPKEGSRHFSPDGKYIVRLYDMFDGWLSAWPSDEGATWEEAVAYWNKHTQDGTKSTCYGDGDYWSIFPAGTQMVVTPEFLGR